MQLLVVHNKEYTERLFTLLDEQKSMHYTHVDSTDDVAAYMEIYDYDLLVIGYDFQSAYQIVKSVRLKGKHIPIIYLSSQAPSSQNTIALLDAGSDEVLTLPLSQEEFLARARVLIRRYRGVTKSCFHIGSLLIDLNDHKVQIDSIALDLSSKELELLECLALNKGRILSKENLLSHLYGGIDEPEARIIDAFVWRLRRKIEDAGGNGSIIQTVWGRGYRLGDENS